MFFNSLSCVSNNSNGPQRVIPRGGRGGGTNANARSCSKNRVLKFPGVLLAQHYCICMANVTLHYWLRGAGEKNLSSFGPRVQIIPPKGKVCGYFTVLFVMGVGELNKEKSA